MMKWSVWLVGLGLLTGCRYFGLIRKQTLTLDAPKELELVVYKHVGKMGQRVLSPVGLIRGGDTIPLEAGDYLVANECSGYEFKSTGEKPIKIPVRRLKLILHGESVLAASPETVSPEVAQPSTTLADTPVPATDQKPEEKKPEDKKSEEFAAADKAVVHTTCVDPLDQQRNQWTHRREFDILPGTTEMRIGGRLVKFENHGETSDPLSLDLYPVVVNSPFPDIHARFYLTPEEKDVKSDVAVIGLEANSPAWLLPGSYSLEVNGTRRNLVVEQGARTDISVGVLRIDMPAHFPLEERLKAGGQPVFVYLDTGALLNLDTDYLVFPGSYVVSIEGSEVQDKFVVEAGQKTVIRTFAARVDAPDCPETVKSCKSAPRVTIHREQKPYALMIVEPRLPFLLLEGNYEYGVEGLRGIKKSLQRRGDAPAGEPLARVRLKWDVRPAQGRIRTDLVRIESRGQSTFGRSLDLLFHKPEEIYVPAGQYDLTYFVGDPLLDRTKSRQSLYLEPGQTREVVVPLYVEKASRSDDVRGGLSGRSSNLQEVSAGTSAGSQTDTGGSDGENAPVALPRTLTPLRR